MESSESVAWSLSAKTDIENISHYLMREWGITVLSRFLTKLNWIIAQIVINPNQYPLFNPDIQIRKCVVTKQNTLFYRIVDNKIEIVRIYDSRQDPNKLDMIF